MNILITGAGGFLGSRLVLRLLADGHMVVGVDMCALPPLFMGAKGLTWIQRDLSCEMLSSGELAGVDTLFHLAGATLGAGLDEHLFCVANEATIIGLLKCCAGHVNRVIHASSQVVYGNVNHLSISENFAVNGFDTAYACSKVNAENWLRWFQHKNSGIYIALRFCGFIEGGGAIDYMIDQAFHDKPIELFSNGQICRDYLPVEKAIESFVASSLFVGKDGFHVFNIGSGQAIKTAELANIVCTEMGSASKIVLLDKSAARANFVFDITKARTEIGFEPGSLAEAVRLYVREKAKAKKKVNV